ncbi:unnamed protein product [Boreogadus saida]
MNLYRSFGNLMESYVSDGLPFSSWDGQMPSWTVSSDTTTPASTPASTPDMGVNLRSTSEDSGFEITPTSLDSSMSSAGHPELVPVSVAMDRGEQGLTPGSALTPGSVLTPALRSSARSLFSASSLYLPGSDADLAPVTRDRSKSLQHKVEQALLKLNPGRRKTNDGSSPDPNAAAAQRRVPRKTMSLPRSSSGLHMVRSESVSEVGRPVHLLLRQAGRQRQRRPASLYHDMRLAETPIEEVNEEARDALSPGLSYLEQVCQMWEQIARLQINNRKLNLEMDVLKDHRDTQPESRLCSCETVLENQHNIHRSHLAEFERVSDELRWQRSNTDDESSSTSPSETERLTRNLGSLKTHTRGQPESETQPAGPADGGQNHQAKQRGRAWLFRTASSRKAASVDSDGSLQGRPSEGRKKTSFRLSLLLRGKTRYPFLIQEEAQAELRR